MTIMTPEELDREIFGILTDYETFKTFGSQKAACRRIAELFRPPYLAKYALKAIIEQLMKCQFVCEAGPLELNTAFLALCELADS